METKNKQITNFNVTEPIHVNKETMNTITATEEVKKKKQKVSISYTLKATRANIQKLIDEKIITKEDGETMKTIHKKAFEHWIGLEFNME